MASPDGAPPPADDAVVEETVERLLALAGLPAPGLAHGRRRAAGLTGPRAARVGGPVRAISYTAPGGPDVLELVDRPVPEPGPGEVRVRVAFSGVNPTDWKSRQQRRARARTARSPNQDGAGTVEAVGEGVDPVLVGERVWIWEAAYQRAVGTAAEYTVVPARQAVLLRRRRRPSSSAPRSASRSSPRTAA